MKTYWYNFQPIHLQLYESIMSDISNQAAVEAHDLIDNAETQARKVSQMNVLT